MNNRKRGAFTLLELTVSVAIIAVMVVIVAQCIALSLQERARTAAHQAALELAANVLEDARAQPFEKLDKTWADAQAIPSDTAALLPDGKIVVTLEPEKTAAKTRRVTVEVQWHFEEHLPNQSVRLTTVFSGREAKKMGGEP
jgi:prepilin-type N-terminal cleavage/methylation domain-containing protein